jgi:hypothetical protein
MTESWHNESSSYRWDRVRTEAVALTKLLVIFVLYLLVIADCVLRTRALAESVDAVLYHRDWTVVDVLLDLKLADHVEMSSRARLARVHCENSTVN